MTMHNVVLAILTVAAMTRHNRHRQQLEQARRFVAWADSFCCEWCVNEDQMGDNER